MSDENVDLRFLGRQVQTLQGDVRDLRADHLRLESDVAGMRADFTRLRAENEASFESVGECFEAIGQRFDRLESDMRAEFCAVDAKFDQVNQTMATNLEVILAAKGARGGASE